MNRLMLVEDDESVRATLCLALEQEYEIQAFASGAEALAAFAQFKPQVVMMDYRMGGLNGTQTMERLLNLPGRAHLVLLSAHLDLNLARQAMRMGASDCLPKPCDLRVLRERLAMVVSSPVPARKEGRPFALRVAENLRVFSNPAQSDMSLDERRLKFQASLFQEALIECYGDRRRAADRLGLGLEEFSSFLNLCRFELPRVGMAA